ncbi:MAG: hypothetical protein ACRCUE_02490, partial [Bosea sp. (in: a-proteobacteria)]
NMVTINRHVSVKNGDQLAEIANRIADNYRRHGRIVKTSSKLSSGSHTVEYMAVALFARPDFTEAAFTRMLMVNGTGYAITYSKRIHDRAAGSKMSDWLLANGPRMETALLGWADHAALAAYASV